MFLKAKVSKVKDERDYLESFIKDQQLFTKINQEFIRLIKDAGLLALLVFNVAMVFQAKSTVTRLKGIYDKKKQRQEL